MRETIYILYTHIYIYIHVIKPSDNYSDSYSDRSDQLFESTKQPSVSLIATGGISQTVHVKKEEINHAKKIGDVASSPPHLRSNNVSVIRATIVRSRES